MKTKTNLLTIVSLFILSHQFSFAASLEVTLTSSDYNGFGVSCNGGRDGFITATVTSNGTAPFEYNWSNEAHTQSIYNLSPGYYHVTVIDANGMQGEAEITLTEPERISVSLTLLTYTNGYHLTCHYCADGRVNTSVNGGVIPYSYNWSDGGFNANRTNMEAGSWDLMVTDLNGCENTRGFGLNAPPREDWQMTGNAGTNPATQYIGTSDNKDLVFKTNGSEGLRLKPNGDIKINNLSGADYNLIVVDQNGIIKRLDVVNQPDPGNPPAPTPWYTGGNVASINAFIGPVNNNDFVIKTGSLTGGTLTEKMRVTTTGKVRIGITSTNLPGTYKLYVADGILAEKVKVALKTTTDWADYVFESNYSLKNIYDLEKYINEFKHLPDIPSAQDLVNDGGFDLGKMDALLLKKIEEQTLYIIDLQKQLDYVKAELNKFSKK